MALRFVQKSPGPGNLTSGTKNGFRPSEYVSELELWYLGPLLRGCRLTSWPLQNVSIKVPEMKHEMSKSLELQSWRRFGSSYLDQQSTLARI